MAGDSEGTRLAIIKPNRCKPKRCNKECKKHCPVSIQGKNCIVVSSKIAAISEVLCTGCGICPNVCPFQAITIIRLPKNLEKHTVHRYGRNSFKLHRLPTPRLNSVLGLVGQNGIGKSTALHILSNKIKPNLGRFDSPPNWDEIQRNFRGSELQNYFKKLVEEEVTTQTKLQYVEQLTKLRIAGNVGELLKARYDRSDSVFSGVEELIEKLDLQHLLTRAPKELSGGELQRFAIAMVAAVNATLYMIDEPSSYLDVRQRLAAGRVIRDLCTEFTYVLCVEHDLAVLDYLSDHVCVLYGEPGVYGVITKPFSVREGINIFLRGFIPTENMRFRTESLSFKMRERSGDDEDEEGEKEEIRIVNYRYPAFTKSHYPKVKGRSDRTQPPKFVLDVEAGDFNSSEIIVLVGENGTGKTTLLKVLAGLWKPDQDDIDLPPVSISYKPQQINAKFPGTVGQLLLSKITKFAGNPLFQNEVLVPLNIDLTGAHKRIGTHNISDQNVTDLSGGECQRVAIALALGKEADVYLLDEPSAYLDVEQRVVVSKVIKRWIMTSRKTAFIVEHDFLMATYLADRVIYYRGTPGVKATACRPDTVAHGFNSFLADIEVTFRRDPTNFRPRINKAGSLKDSEQKAAGNYFFIDNDDEDDEE